MKTLIKILFLSLLATTAVVACKSKENTNGSGETKIYRYEQLMFDTPTDKLPSALTSFKNEFNSPLLNIYPDKAEFMEQIYGFVSDQTVRDIYAITERHYHDLGWLDKELNKALRKAAELDDEIAISKIATFVSGYFDYNSRILADRESGSLLISIDQYAIGDMEKYNYFDLPMFIVELSDSSYLASDIMAEIARQYIAAPSEESTTMLDLMVSEGKVLYFLDCVMPKKADRLKIRYNEEQMKWMQENESKVWAYFIHNGLLYEKDFNRYHNFVDEAPKTNAFKDSAPRTTQYIGWQIVRKYMGNNKCSIKELFENTNSQAILAASKYKP